MQQKSKIFQPKYPSLTAQKRQQRHVYVPKDQLPQSKLEDGDEFRWVWGLTSKMQSSEGWITTKKQMEAQCLCNNSQKLWLPKQQLIAYAVPSTNQPTIQQHQPKVHKARSQGPKKKASRKPKRTSYYKVPSWKYTERWVPKSLLIAQGYYEGYMQIWVPKHRQPTPQRQNRTLMWKPKDRSELSTTTNLNELNANTLSSTVSSKKVWRPKRTEDKSNTQVSDTQGLSSATTSGPDSCHTFECSGSNL